MAETATKKKVRHGANIKKFCDLLQVTPDDLAIKINKSLEEVNEIIATDDLPEETISEIAEALNIPPAAIKGMEEETTSVNIQYNYDGSNPKVTNVGAAVQNHYCVFYPVNTIVELYERILNNKDTQISLLEKIVEELQKKNNS